MSDEDPTLCLCVDPLLFENCETCTNDLAEVNAYLDDATFPRTALGQTDQLGHDRDESEARRAGAIDLGPMLTDADLIAPAPANSQTCGQCGTLHGRWIKTHSAQGESKPCKGSW